MAVQAYPEWIYFPRNNRAPVWTHQFVATVQEAEADISTVNERTGLTSDSVLRQIAEGLRTQGYEVESGKKATQRIKRPVLFGDGGRPAVSFEIDAFHADLGIAVEVEAGRGARGNATYRDLIRASLILDAQYLALVLPIAYRHQSGGKQVSVAAYRDCHDLLSAVYASQRLALPFRGVLLVGY